MKTKTNTRKGIPYHKAIRHIKILLGTIGIGTKIYYTGAACGFVTDNLGNIEKRDYGTLSEITCLINLLDLPKEELKEIITEVDNQNVRLGEATI